MAKLSTIAGICRKHSVDFEVCFTHSESYVRIERIGNSGDGVGACHEIERAGAKRITDSVSHRFVRYQLESTT